MPILTELITDLKVKSTQKIPTTSKRTRNIIYPILMECAQLCTDDFWRQFYEDLATGKSPKGIYISNGTIYTTNKRTGIAYSISQKPPRLIVIELHDLLTTKTSICSSKDLDKKRKIIDEIQTDLNKYRTGKWTSIKRKNIKYMLLVNYALKLRAENKLTWKQTIAVFITIQQAFELKTHKSKDVVYNDGEIHDIIDLEINDDGYLENLREIPDEIVIEKVNQGAQKIMLQDLFTVFFQTVYKNSDTLDS